MIEAYTIIHRHRDGRWVKEAVDRDGSIDYTANFDLDQAMTEHGNERNWDPHTFYDADNCKNNGYMMIGSWLETNEFDYDE